MTLIDRLPLPDKSRSKLMDTLPLPDPVTDTTLTKGAPLSENAPLSEMAPEIQQNTSEPQSVENPYFQDMEYITTAPQKDWVSQAAETFLGSVGLGGVALEVAGAPLRRANKAITALIEPFEKAGAPLQEYALKRMTLLASRFQGVPEEVLEEEAKQLRPDINWSELKKVPGAMATALKMLVPVPGIADADKTFGEFAGERYQEMTGEPPPWGYKGGLDVAAEVVLSGVGTQIVKAASQGTPVPKVINDGPLSSTEIKEAKKLFAPRWLAKMDPVEVRKQLAISNQIKLIEGQPVVDPAGKLTTLLKKAKRMNVNKAQLKHEELVKRVARMNRIRDDVYKRTGNFKLATSESKKALAGELPTLDFTPPQGFLSHREWTSLYDSIRTSSLQPFNKMNAVDALTKILDGQLPATYEIRLLQSVFGKELGTALNALRPVKSKIGYAAMDILHLPKSLMASYDISAPLRQGGLLAPGNPKAWFKSWKPMLKSLKNDDVALAIDKALDANQGAALRASSGVYKAPLPGQISALAEREEAFISGIAEAIPGIRMSERAYVTFLNQLRANAFDDAAQALIRAGHNPQTDIQVFKDLASYINHASGRGDLGSLAKAGPALNVAMFSPRYQISRLQVPIDLFTKSAPVRKKIASDLVKFVGVGAGLLALAKMGGAEVELNSTSSDFGKVKIGNTRYDFWAGYSQLARAVSQLAQGKYKSTGTKKEYELGRDVVLGRYLRTKLSPTAGLTYDILSGTTFTGDPIDLATPAGIGEQAWNHLTPLFVQDVVDAIRYQGLDATIPITAAGALTGVGVQTYQPTETTKAFWLKNRIAQETYGKNWEDLSPSQVHVLMRTEPALEEAQRQVKMARTNARYVALSAEQAMVNSDDVRDRLSVLARQQLEEASVRISGISRLHGDWVLNDDRLDAYKQKIADNITEFVSQTDWSSIEDISVKRKLLENIIRISKDRALRTIEIAAENE